MNLSKTELFKKSRRSEEIAAPKMLSCYIEVVALKKYEEVASLKIKFLRN